MPRVEIYMEDTDNGEVAVKAIYATDDGPGHFDIKSLAHRAAMVFLHKHLEENATEIKEEHSDGPVVKMPDVPRIVTRSGELWRP